MGSWGGSSGGSLCKFQMKYAQHGGITRLLHNRGGSLYKNKNNNVTMCEFQMKLKQWVGLVPPGYARHYPINRHAHHESSPRLVRHKCSTPSDIYPTFFRSARKAGKVGRGRGGRKSCQRVRVGRGSNVKCVNVQLATGFKIHKSNPHPAGRKSSSNTAGTSFSASLRAAAMVLKSCKSYRISRKPCE